MSLAEIYSFIYLIPMLLSAIFSLKAFTQKWPKPFKIFSVYLIVCLTIEIVSLLLLFEWIKPLFGERAGHNLWLYNFGLIVEQSIMLIFFYHILNHKGVRKIVGLFILTLVPFAFLNYFFLQGAHVVNSHSIVPFEVLTIIFGTIYFSQTINNNHTERLFKNPLIWILLGVFVYNLVAVNFFLTISYLSMNYQNIASIYFYVNDGMNIISYSFFLIAFLCKPHPKSPSTLSPYPVS